MFNLKVAQIKGGVNITWDDISSEVVTYMVEITQGISINHAVLLKLDPLIRSLRSLLKDLTKSLTKVKSGDLSILTRRKLSFDWLLTHVTE